MLSCLTFLVLALSDRSWSRSALISASDIAVGPRLASLLAYVVLHMMPLNSDKAGWHWLGRGRLHSCIARRHPGRVHTQPTAGPAGPAAPPLQNDSAGRGKLLQGPKRWHACVMDDLAQSAVHETAAG